MTICAKNILVIFIQFSLSNITSPCPLSLSLSFYASLHQMGPPHDEICLF